MNSPAQLFLIQSQPGPWPVLCSLDLLSGCSDQLRAFSFVFHPHPLPSPSLSAFLPLLTPPPLSPYPPLLLLSCLHLLSSSSSSSLLLDPSTASLTLNPYLFTSLFLPVIHPLLTSSHYSTPSPFLSSPLSPPSITSSLPLLPYLLLFLYVSLSPLSHSSCSPSGDPRQVPS